ncbi:hypothetical protein WR25_22443 [Diploscapter pachys]|uniref:Uncharacterized protein n=1 Tax=Diploscapter pachys TaxID=2018661 RepID=A0A2A2LUD8_9BILA|nr:hypothetical protein WR25_22443 [Diploscapter pachys]
MGDQIYGDTIIHALPHGSHKTRKISWYFSKKDPPEVNQIFDDSIMEPSTSNETERKLPLKDIDVYEKENRFCYGYLSPTYVANAIIIALIQEITLGLILAIRVENDWWMHPQLVVLILCRLLQYIPAVLALLGNYIHRASLLIPFMMSQISLGSYADLQTYMQIISRFQKSSPDSILLITPLLYMVLPILLYANIANVKESKGDMRRNTDTQIESLIV